MWEFKWGLFKSHTWPKWEKGLKFFAICLVVALLLSFFSTSEEDYICESEPLFGQNCGLGKSFNGDWAGVLVKGVGLCMFGTFSQIYLNSFKKDKNKELRP